MNEENLEFEDTLENPSGDSASETETSTELDSDNVEELKAALKDALEREQKEKRAKEQLFARLKKLESKIEKVVKQDEGGKNDAEWKEKIEFLVKRRDFDADELEIVSAFAKGMNKPLEEAVKHPAVEGALKALREKKAAEKATLEASSRSGTGEETSLLAKWRAGKLSDEEFRKNFRKIQEEFFAQTQGTKSYE